MEYWSNELILIITPMILLIPSLEAMESVLTRMQQLNSPPASYPILASSKF
jgi:hypothetical protein